MLPMHWLSPLIRARKHFVKIYSRRVSTVLKKKLTGFSQARQKLINLNTNSNPKSKIGKKYFNNDAN